MSTPKLAQIEIFSHGVRISKVSPEIDHIIREFCHTFIQYKLEKVNGRWVKKQDKIYGYINKVDRTLLFHRNQFHDFVNRCKLSGYDMERFDLIEYEIEPGVDTYIKMKPEFTLREKQVPAANWLREDNRIRTAELQTGFGKSFLYCNEVAASGKRGGLVVLPRYIDKWYGDFGKYYDIEPQDILLIKSGKTLMDAMLLIRDGRLPDFKVAMFSLSTINKFIEHFESSDAETYMYPFTPFEFMQLLGIHVLGFDEVHQCALQVFTTIIHFHVPKQVYLSATLVSDDDFTLQMYNVAFPNGERFRTVDYNRYIDVVAIEYGIREPRKIRCSYRGKEYNHAAFEDSLRRNGKLFKQYLNLIWSIVKHDFLTMRTPGMKMLIFAAKKETCDAIVGHIKRKLGDNPANLRVSKYVAEDAYEVLLESDITASTLGSSGTAVDIPDLVKVLMTNNLAAIAANIQAVGRLRELKKWPDVKLEFFYLYCRDIPKHVEYHRKKIGDLKGRVRSHRTLVSPVTLDVNLPA